MCVPGRPAGRRRLEFGLGCSLLAGQRSKDLRNYLITQTSVLPPSLPKASAAAATPLALLLATANKPAAPLPLLPLAPLRPTGLRIKRKPQISKFRPKERKRFRPRARVTKSSVNEAGEEEKENNNEDNDLVTKLRTREPASKIQSNKVHTGSRFSVFGRRPRPGLVTPERRRAEEEVAEKEEKKEKQEEKENTVSHRQPITLQAKLIWVYVDILIIVIILTLIMTHRQVQPPCLLLSWRTSLALPSQWQRCCPQGSLNFFVLISAESRSPFLPLGSPSLLATT